MKKYHYKKEVKKNLKDDKKKLSFSVWKWVKISSNSSLIKQTALEIASLIDELANQEIKSSVIKKFWNWFFTSHAKTIIHNKPDEELKKLLEKSYLKLKPIFEKTNIAVSLKESIKFNSPTMNKKLMQLPDFEKALSLIDEL